MNEVSLYLLEHDLADPDSVRVVGARRVAPGQIPLVHVVPASVPGTQADPGTGTGTGSW